MTSILKYLELQNAIASSQVPEFVDCQQQTGLPMSQVLIERGVDPELVVEAISEALGVARVSSIDEVTLSVDNARSFGFKRCYTDKIVPVEYMGCNYLMLFSLDDATIMTELRESRGFRDFCVATPALVQQCLDKFISPLLTQQNSQELGGGDIVQDVSMDMDTDDNKTIETLALIMKAAYGQHASDVIIVGEGDKAEVKFRVDGQYILYSEMTTSSLSAIVQVLANTAGLSARSSKSMYAGKIELESPKQQFKSAIRFNFIPTKLGGSLNVRFLSDAKIIDYASLGMSQLMQKRLHSLENISQGLVLIVGPTGSGKSTTMLAYISNVQKKNVNICTVEDPVEAVITGTNQVDISDAGNGSADPKTALTFSNVLKSFMRHDPDVIMVGEIRDLEVAETALQAADTGHLVISTIHTKDAVSSISRLVGLGVKPYMICDSLVAVVAQRLVRRVCPACKETYELPKDHHYRKLFNLGDRPITLTRGRGCSACNGTGYRGRMVISECMVMTPALREAIELRKPTTELYDIVKRQGFIDMVTDGVNKALEGHTTLDELFKFAQDRNLEDIE